MLNVLLTMYFYLPPANKVSASGPGIRLWSGEYLPLVWGTDTPLGRHHRVDSPCADIP